MLQPVFVLATEGFALNLGLLLAIGAQASFVLRQGLAQRHVACVVVICCSCDAVLICLGTLGPGSIAVGGPVGRCLALAGAAFMVTYGARALRSAWRAGRAARPATAAAEERLAAAMLAALAVTLLNPHVYVDSLVLLRSAAARYPPPDRAWFALGAVAASIMWFLALGYGAVLLAGLLNHPRVRAALDLLVCAIMWRTAAVLITAA